MKHASLILLWLLLANGVLAQDASVADDSRSAYAADAAKASRAALRGVVTKDPGSEPVKKVLMELIAENPNEGGNYTALTGADGSFHMEGIAPGRYRLFAERTGYMEVDRHRRRTEGLVLTLTGGQEVNDLVIRLQAAAVIEGRVTDEDGDPMANAQVAVLRQTFASGRSRWEQSAAEGTNDLGEFRIARLAAGTYYISVTPPVDPKRWIEAAGKGEPQSRSTASSNKSRPMAYTTTYYPGTTDRAQAAPIQLHPGDDLPVNFSLTRSPSLAIRGSIGMPAGTSAVVMLQHKDLAGMLTSADVRKDGSFEIPDVSPGTYTLVAMVTGPSISRMARQAVQVVSSDVEGVRLVLQSAGWVRGRLRIESKGGMKAIDISQISLVLASVDGDADMMTAFSFGESVAANVRVTADSDGSSLFSFAEFSPFAHVNADGTFEWKNVPPGRYFVQLAGDGGPSAKLFLKSAVAGNRDVKDVGLTVSGGANALDVMASTGVAEVEGVVINAKGEPVANAIVVAVPEAHLRSRIDYFRKTVSDQSGRFGLRGVRPGAYTLFAWESVDGEDYYNPEFLRGYEGQGKALTVGEGDHTSVQLNAAPGAEDEP